MKKLPAIAIVVLALLAGGCSIPISPLMFLIKDQPAPLNQATPDSPQPAQVPATPAPISGDNTSGAA